MPEVVFRVKGDQDVTRAIREVRSEGKRMREELARSNKEGAQPLNAQLREVSKALQAANKDLAVMQREVKEGVVVSLREARTMLQNMGGDMEKLRATLRLLGVDQRDINLLTRETGKEWDENRRKVLGIQTVMGRLTQAIKDGSLQASAMAGFFEKAQAAIVAIKALGGAKSFAENTTDAVATQEKYDTLQEKTDLVGTPEKNAKFTQLRQNVRRISLGTNIPQSVLLDALLKAEEAQSAGKELALDNGGALLEQLARTAYGDRSEDVPESIKTSVDLYKGLKFKDAGELRTAQGVIRAGEQKGAISAQQIGNKGGLFIGQLAELQGTSGLEALRRGSALYQAEGSAPGINGNFAETDTRLKDLLGKLVDPRTRARLKEAFGVNTLTPEGKLREIPTILSELARTGAVPTTDEDLKEAERDPKKKAKFVQFFEVFREQQSRQGLIGLLSQREKIRPLENVSAEEGTRLLEGGFTHRSLGLQAGKDAIQRRDEETHLADIEDRQRKINRVTNVVSAAEAQHPYAAAGLGVVGDIAGYFGGAKWKVAGDSLTAGLLAAATDTTIPKEKSDQARWERQYANFDSATKRFEEAVTKLTEVPPGGVQVQVQEGLHTTVTPAAKTSQQAAKSGTRTPRPGQR